MFTDRLRQNLLKLFFVSGIVSILCAGCNQREGVSEMIISSPVFKGYEYIPVKYTCKGEDINPPLKIAGIPDNAVSLVLIVDDPDAPMGTWTHWVVYNMDKVNYIEEDSVPGLLAMNSFGRLEYGGPCPPSGTHRYFFKLYALDTTLNIGDNPSREDIEHAMDGHVLAESSLVGLFSH